MILGLLCEPAPVYSAQSAQTRAKRGFDPQMVVIGGKALETPLHTTVLEQYSRLVYVRDIGIEGGLKLFKPKGQYGWGATRARFLVLAAASVMGLSAQSAMAQGDRLASTSGVVVLNSNAVSGALTFSGTVHIRVPVIFVNSSSSTAVIGSGNGIIDTPTLNVVGGVHFNGTAACTGSVVSAPGPMMDPYSNMSMPAANSNPDRGALSIRGGRCTVSPGYYSGGISIGGGADVTFSPGVYVLGNNFNFTSGSAVGQGVTFIMLGGSVSIGGNATKNFSAPTTGSYAGVFLAQPPSNASGMSIVGGSEMTITGCIWAPAATATISGNSTVSGTGPAIGDSLIVNKLVVSGTGVIKLGRPSDTIVPPQINGLYD